MEESKLYTGGGDRGMTSLAGGCRVPKTHLRVEAYGTIDELNSFIGLLRAETGDKETQELLRFIQTKLFTAGAYLATGSSTAAYRTGNGITGACIKKIEAAIDEIDSGLPRLKTFVLPGGTRTAAIAHVCRTVCRRAERTVFRLAESEKMEENVPVFINRLSDLLFVIARKECVRKNGEDFFEDNPCK